MSAKWIIKKSWEISQLRLPLMEMVIDEWLKALESKKIISNKMHYQNPSILRK